MNTKSMNDIDKEEVWNVGEKLLDNIFDATNECSYDLFVRDFDPSLKSLFSESSFKLQIIGLMAVRGKLASRRKLDILYQEEGLLLLWVAHFDQTDEEFLIQLRLVTEGSEYNVKGIIFG